MDGRVRWRTTHLEHSPRYYESVDSTQAQARRLIEQGSPDGMIIVAGEQTAGRGRLGREWASPKGNLYVSLLLHPPLPVAVWPQCTMIAALAIGGALDALPLSGVTLKWPNDVLIAERKVAGILAEVYEGKLILGFGVNVNAQVPPELAQATSLAQALGHAVHLETLLAGMIERIDADYDALLCGKRFTNDWARRLSTVGRTVDATIAGRAVHGVAEGVADDGALQLRRADGTLESFRAADVTLRADFPQVSAQKGAALDAEVEAEL